MDVLAAVGWLALPIAGDGNIQLTASGNIRRCAVETDGKRQITRGQRNACQQITQTMQAGVVSGGEVTSTEPTLCIEGLPGDGAYRAYGSASFVGRISAAHGAIRRFRFKA